MPSVYAAPPEFVHAPLRLSETALRTWFILVVDPTDRGTLAALNAYGHDYLRGLARQTFLESRTCGFSV